MLSRNAPPIAIGCACRAQLGRISFWWYEISSQADVSVPWEYVVGARPPSLIFFGDAAPTVGYGAFCLSRYVYGEWPDAIFGADGRPSPDSVDHEWSTAFLELAAALFGLYLFCEGSRDKADSVLIFCDNETVVQAWRNRSSPSRRFMNLIRLFVEHVVRLHIWDVDFMWLPSASNFVADELSRQGSQVFCLGEFGWHGLTTRCFVPEDLTASVCAC